MSNLTENYAETVPSDLRAIQARAERLRGEEMRRLAGALKRRIGNAIAGLAGGRAAGQAG
ncbi:MAG: hypothetical protein OXC28_03855 [Defluviicoccus sp.]|nr:hypothetical protein [Defluviicoccus sp.]